MTLEQIINFIKEWRKKNNITGDNPLNEQQIKQFAIDLQREVDKFPVRPEKVSWAIVEGEPTAWTSDSRPIPYSGELGLPFWKYASVMSKEGLGKVFYISDTPAGKLLNNPDFKNERSNVKTSANSSTESPVQIKLICNSCIEIHEVLIHVNITGKSHIKLNLSGM